MKENINLSSDYEKFIEDINEKNIQYDKIFLFDSFKCYCIFFVAVIIVWNNKIRRKIETKMVSISYNWCFSDSKNSATLIQDTLDKNQNLSEQILNDENLQNKIEKN